MESLQCEHCAGERFHLVIVERDVLHPEHDNIIVGRITTTEIQCINMSNHEAELE